MNTRTIAAVLAFATGTVAQTGDVFDPPVRLQADGADIDVGKYVAHAGPLVMDYDRDGLPDLLVGTFAGHIQVFRNAGTRQAPKLVDEGLMEAEGEIVKIKNW
jgi:hypothetical protein